VDKEKCGTEGSRAETKWGQSQEELNNDIRPGSDDLARLGRRLQSAVVST
jgi:hypothetical protein